MYVSKVYEYAVDAYGDVRTLVRGITFQCPDDWEDILDSLDEDSNLYLLKEPDNPKDKLAIAAYLDDRRIGYVAASDNGKIWLYMTDEKMPCQFIERFEASFKIAFENPRPLFEDMPFKEIYKDKYGVTEQPLPAFDIPFLFNPKDKRYEWFDDRIYIADLERVILDFHRKLATRMIVIAGRKNSKGEYNYYLPYANNPIADVEDNIIKGIIDRYGFVIALPDVPVINTNGGISMDVHVTFLKNTNFKDFNAAHQSELVFSLTKDYYVNSQKAVGVQNVADGNYDSNQRKFTNEDNGFMQNTLSTPSYSNTDYKIKKGEVTDFSIDKDTFAEIDKITTELYTFVRQDLYPSMELFSYLKKHTPYYNQFYDFGQYETLISIFVVKDLGRIYKGLNHSFNFDTTGGKLLFLYMEKEIAKDPEISYSIFNEICNPHSQLKTAVEMREVIENQTKSFYEYYIELWTDTDFIIHSLLKEVDDELAKRYVDLMRKFASVIDDTNEKTIDSSTDSAKRALSPIDEFFPLFGVTLGKTTWKQVEHMGYEVELWKDGPNRYVNIEEVTFWDDEGVGTFTSMCLSQDDSEFPHLWKEKGFSWNLSYNEWIALFTKMGYQINVIEQPINKLFHRRYKFYARFNAVSPDGSLLFEMDFNKGGNGFSASSPKTIDTITVVYKESNVLVSRPVSSKEEKATSQAKHVNEELYSLKDSPDGARSFPRFTQNQESKTSITPMKSNTNLSTPVSAFFPVGGITLGVTTWKQAEEKGFVVEVWEEGPSRCVKVNDFTFWDFKGQGVFTYMCERRSWHGNNFPPLWESKGFSWDNSYDQWMDVFKKLGFIVIVKRQPSQKEQSNHLTLEAEFEASSLDNNLLFNLDFSYGQNGHYTSSSNTLYSISVQYKGPVAAGTVHANSEVDSKTSGKVNHDEKESLNNKIQDAVFHHCIFAVLGVDLTNTPNSKWEYESWNLFGGGYETYVFSAPDVNTWKFKKCEAIVNRNRNTNYKFKELNVDTVLSLIYHYRKVFDSSYRYEQCIEEYLNILDDSIGSISIETNPWLYIRRSDGYGLGDSKTAKYDVLLYTSQYNKEYIDELISQKKLITIF